MARKKASTEPTPTPPEELSYEQAMEELESIIEQIEQGEIGLEQSLAQRKRGDHLIKRCRAILDKAEQELEEREPENERGGA